MLQLTTILFLITFSVFAVVHTIATKLFLYWHFSWLDLPMHLFGGVLISLGLFTLRDIHVFPNSLLKPFPVLFISLLVALLWETFEWMIGVPMLSDFILDTSIDISLGLCGGYIGYLVGNSLRNLR